MNRTKKCRFLKKAFILIAVLLIGCGTNEIKVEEEIGWNENEIGILAEAGDAFAISDVKISNEKIAVEIENHLEEASYYSFFLFDEKQLDFIELSKLNMEEYIIFDYTIDDSDAIAFVGEEIESGNIILASIDRMGNVKKEQLDNSLIDNNASYQIENIATNEYLFGNSDSIYLLKEESIELVKRFEKATDYDMSIIDSSFYAIRTFDETEYIYSIYSFDEEKKIFEFPIATVLNCNFTKTQNGFIGFSDSKVILLDEKGKLLKSKAWADFGIMGNDVRGVITAQGSLLVILENENGFSILGPQQGKKQNKVSLTLGCVEESSRIREVVSDFNKENSEVEIEIRDYSEVQGQEPINALYNDILSGNGPDIIQFDSTKVNDVQLVDAGMLEPLDELIENSNKISKESFVPSILKAIEVNSKIYYLPTNFYIVGNYWLKDVINQDGRVSKEDLLTFLDNAQEYSIQLSGEDFLCDMAYFDLFSPSEDIDSLLNTDLMVAAKLPQTSIYEEDTLVKKSGNMLVESTLFCSVEDYLIKKSEWGEAGCFAGYPTKEGNGCLFYPVNSFGINSKSKHKEESWKFIEGLIDEKQIEDLTTNYYMFSTNNEILEQQLEKAEEFTYYMDSEGNRQLAPITTYLENGENVNVYPATKEDISEIRKLISQTNMIKRDTKEIEEILMEEVQVFFAGQRNEEETVSIIINRLNQYYEE